MLPIWREAVSEKSGESIMMERCGVEIALYQKQMFTGATGAQRKN